MCGKREIWILRTHSGGVGTTPGLPLVASPLHAVRAQHRRFTRSDIGQNWSDVSTGTVSLATRGFIPGAHLRRCTRFVRRGHGRKQCYFCRSSFVSVYIWVCVCVSRVDDYTTTTITMTTTRGSPLDKRFRHRWKGFSGETTYYFIIIRYPVRRRTHGTYIRARSRIHSYKNDARKKSERERETRDMWLFRCNTTGETSEG